MYLIAQFAQKGILQLTHSMERLKLNIYADIQVVENMELQDDIYSYNKCQTGYIKICPGSTIIIGFQSGAFETPKTPTPCTHNFPYQYELEMFSSGIQSPLKNGCEKQHKQMNFQVNNMNRQTNLLKEGKILQQNNFEIIESNRGINIKHLWNKRTHFIPCELIRVCSISKAQQKAKKNSQESCLAQCLYIDFEHGGMGKIKQLLLIPETFKQDQQRLAEFLVQLKENIEFRRLMIAAARGTLLNSLALFRGMECNEVDFKNKKEQIQAFHKIRKPLENTLKSQGVSSEKCNQLLGEKDPSKIIWRRIGFQSSVPQSDFRASGSLGLLSVIYACFTVPNFILNGSFAEELKSDDDVDKYLTSFGEGLYQYPVCVSIINVTHKILSQQHFIQEKAQNNIKPLNVQHKLKQQVFQQVSPNEDILLSLLSNEYIGEWIVIINNIDSVIQALTVEIQADSENQQIVNVDDLIGVKTENHQINSRLKWLQEYKAQLSQIKDLYNNSQCCISKICQAIIGIPNPESQLVSSKPLWLAEKATILSSLSPNLGSQLLKLIVSLSVALGERLSHFEHTQQYLNYPSQFDVFISDFLAALKSKDVYCIDDLVYKMRCHWQ